MIVCVCNNISDTQIRNSDAELAELGVGQVCGTCMETAQRIRDERGEAVPAGDIRQR